MGQLAIACDSHDRRDRSCGQSRHNPQGAWRRRTARSVQRSWAEHGQSRRDGGAAAHARGRSADQGGRQARWRGRQLTERRCGHRGVHQTRSKLRDHLGPRSSSPWRRRLSQARAGGPVSAGPEESAMDFGIFNLMGSRDVEKPTSQVFGEVTEQTKLADELGYTIAWFAEHHFSNYCLCASPLMMVAHCAPITKKIRLGTAVVVLPLYNPARLAAEIATADALSNGRLMLGLGAGYQPYEFERFGVDIKANLEMTDEFCDILDLAFSRDFFSYHGKHYRMPDTHIPARPMQNPLPIYVAGHTQAMFRSAARHGYRVLSSGRVGGVKLLAEQYADIVAAFAAESAPLSRAHITINRFAHITDSRQEGLRFAENARYQTRLASSLRRRQEVMQGTVLVDVPFPDEPPLERIYDDLLIGDVDTVAEKLVAEIHATR